MIILDEVFGMVWLYLSQTQIQSFNKDVLFASPQDAASYFRLFTRTANLIVYYDKAIVLGVKILLLS